MPQRIFSIPVLSTSHSVCSSLGEAAVFAARTIYAEAAR
jgi:hypothetical protein